MLKKKQWRQIDISLGSRRNLLYRPFNRQIGAARGVGDAQQKGYSASAALSAAS
jgi:hypothetical protein